MAAISHALQRANWKDNIWLNVVHMPVHSNNVSYCNVQVKKHSLTEKHIIYFSEQYTENSTAIKLTLGHYSADIGHRHSPTNYLSTTSG